MPIRITGLNSGLDTEAIISALVSSYNYKTNKYKKAQTKLSWKQDAWKGLNTKIYSLYTSVGNLRFSTAYNMKSTTVSDSTKVSVKAGSSSVNGSYSVQVTSLAKAGYLTGARLNAGTTASTTLGDLGYTGESGKLSVAVGGNTTDITVSKDSTIQEVVNKLKEAGVNASYDEANRRFFVSAKETGVENDFALSGGDASGTAALTVLGLNAASTANTAEYDADGKVTGTTLASNSGATRVNGSDAKIYVNGAEYEGDSNTFSINGLTITASGITTTEAEMQAAIANGTEAIGAVNVTVNTDVQGIYDKVKTSCHNIIL